ncbi:MAG: NADH-quinone oxidoreductase subunit M [Candidatus Poribacteria bacterium]|nr:NADH-quinone oxidoreductase subunit M [Candidatus Poribacteria bacterium]
MLLSLMIFIPLLGMVVVLLLPRESEELVKRVTLIFTLIPLALAVYLFITYDRATAGTQYVHGPYDWIEAFNIQYHIGIDGLSVTLLLLTALLGPICVIASWRNIEKGIKAYMALFLLLETGMLGFFAALDLFLFYVFFELTLLPMYFLIGVWGGPRREYAAIKFFLYTLFGSVLMLVAMIAVYLNSNIVNGVAEGARTFDIPTLITLAATQGHALADSGFQMWVFVGFFIGFAVKVPIFPFHTWLPDAHVEAPTAISVILAGILLKMGTYGLVRVNMAMFPQGLDHFTNGIGFWGNSLALLGFINIVYGSFCALAQTDFKKLVAYSSIGHMGFVILGLAARNDSGITGAILQMFNHGVISAMLFLLVGVLYDRAHHREINGFGGLGTRMPIYTGITTLAFMASLGLPGLSGFVGEALSLLGAYDKFKFLTILSTIGIVVGAAYFLWTLQRVFLGTLNPKYEALPEINGREILTLVPLGILTIVLGVWPNFAIDMFSESVTNLIDVLNAR